MCSKLEEGFEGSEECIGPDDCCTTRPGKRCERIESESDMYL